MIATPDVPVVNADGEVIDGITPDDSPSLNELAVASDLDASLRFATANSDVLRYCPGVGWLFWDGRRWCSNAESKAIELSKRTARRWTERALENASATNKSAVNAALTMESSGHISAAVNLAKSDERLLATAGSLDACPWVLNVLNGTLDLKTGVLRPHDQGDLITKLAPVTFNPDAKSAALDKVLGACEAATPGMADFLSRCFGCALTGSAEAETLFLLQGDGGSGKTTLVESVSGMLGDYAVKLPFESFCQSRHGRSPGGASPDLVKLRGSRLAYASEGDQSARLDAGMVKTLTGDEPFTARALYSEPITFPQTWKLWLVSNYEPKADSDDTGIWRRMLKLKFMPVPVPDRDPRIKAELRNNDDARSALLNWTLAGCLDWQRRGGGRIGLAAPQAVQEETEAYRGKQDALAEWWEDLQTASELSAAEFTAGALLRSNYTTWCEMAGVNPLGSAKFNAYIESKGLRKDKATGGLRGWRGIRLLDT